MHSKPQSLSAGLVLAASFLLATPASSFAQGLQKRDTAPVTVSASVSLTPDVRVEIRDFYATRGVTGAEALPPGIRKRLAQGKPLPPGIAKRAVPADLRSRVRLPAGYEIVEVGLDVLLVEVGTDIVRDVLRDVVG